MSSVVDTPKTPPYIPPYLRRRKLIMDASDCSARDVQKLLQTNKARQAQSFRVGTRVETAKSATLSDSTDSFEELINIVQQSRRSNMRSNEYSSNPGGSRGGFGPLQLVEESGRDTTSSAASHQYEDLSTKVNEVGENLKKMVDALDIEKGRRFARSDRMGRCCKVADFVS